MARDIEEFLRKAAERRRQKLQQQPPQQRQPQPPPRPAPPPVHEVVEAAEVEIIRQEKRRPAGRQSVEEHVSAYIDTSDIAEHTRQLGERIQSRDDRVAERLHQKFDHEVGKLEDKPTVTNEPAAGVTTDEISPIANDLIQMLRSPVSVRQAILISEILKRPSFDD